MYSRAAFRKVLGGNILFKRYFECFFGSFQSDLIQLWILVSSLWTQAITSTCFQPQEAKNSIQIGLNNEENRYHTVYVPKDDDRLTQRLNKDTKRSGSFHLVFPIILGCQLHPRGGCPHVSLNNIS